MFNISVGLKNQKSVSADHLFSLLEYILLYGSISRAASQAGVSYRYAWGLLLEAEQALNVMLVEKQVGGYAGGGAHLTSAGKWLLQEYKQLKTNIEQNLAMFHARIGQPNESKEEMADEREKTGNCLLLASTMEPVETGLLDELESRFFQEKAILIRHIAAGSGKALEIARAGRVDMTLTHAPNLEEEFMQEGWGTYQYPIMINDFIIIGPRTDPAKIGQINNKTTAKEIFHQIASTGASFVSRGDYSGTHIRETDIWKKAGIKPGGNWYLLYPGVAGNLGAIRFARERKAYLLTDTASYYLSHSDDVLKIFLDSNMTLANRELKNIYILTLVNPQKIPSSRLEDALKFAHWLQRNKGKKIIGNFGRKRYNRPLFTPFSMATATGMVPATTNCQTHKNNPANPGF